MKMTVFEVMTTRMNLHMFKNLKQYILQMLKEEI